MTLSIRLKEILEQIIGQAFTPINELTKKYNVTDRTIRTDIATLNFELRNYECEILLKRKHGYYLEIRDDTKYKELLTFLQKTSDTIEINSLQDRIQYILQILLYEQDYIILDNLAEKIYVSRNTLQNYMKTIKEILEKYNLMYVSKSNKGIKVFGNEKDKRECLVNEVLSKDNPTYLVEFSPQEQFLFKEVDLCELNKIISKCLKKFNINTNDYDRKNLVIHFALMLSRLKSENYIPYDPSIPIQDDAIEMLNSICAEIENKYDVQITNGEKQYIYLHIVTNTNLKIGTINPLVLETQIKTLLEIIYKEYNFDLRNDEILKKDLFNHFSSIFSTRNITMHKKNPLLNTIKSNFPLPFEITLTSTSKVFNEPLNEDEVGYVSLHIGAAIERCFSGQYNKKHVLLVCGSGIATTRMLEARLQAFFNNKIIIMNKISYEEFKTYDFKNIDFVISTIPIQSDSIPVEVVNFALNNSDIEKISRRLSSMNNSVNTIAKFFDRQLFLHKKNTKSKEEIINQLCHLLFSQEIVNKDYYASVLKRESLAKTNMNTLFAIPHPMNPCSSQTKVAVAILDEPIEWNNEHESVQIIFMLSIKAGDQQDIEHLYDLFIEIVNNSKLQQGILKITNYEDFIKLISTAIDSQ